MTFVLWDDLPLSQKGVRRGTVWYGCPYAVKLEWWDRGTIVSPGYIYGRCGGAPRGEGMPCWMHGPRTAPSGDLLLRRAYWTIKRSHLTLAQFRAMTDADIDAMRNVGVKLSDRLREIRDTWDDERVLETFVFRDDAPPPPPDATEFWKQRHDIFQIVGG